MKTLNWKLIAPFGLLGAGMGLLDTFAVTKGFETPLYQFAGLCAGVVIGWLAPGRPLLHGFIAGTIGYGLAGVVQLSLWSIYAERAPDVIARGEAMIPGIELRTLGFIILPFMACVGGGLVGIVAWGSGMAFRKTGPHSPGNAGPGPVNQLKQKRFVETREYYLEPERLRCLTKDADGEFEYFANYEDLRATRRNRVEQSPYVYYAALSFSAFSAFGLVAYALGAEILSRWIPVWILAAMVFWGFHIVRRRCYVLIEVAGDKFIYFLRDNPTRARLEEFLTEMYMAKRRYLREHYARIDFDNDRQNELDKFAWLLRERAITEEEYDEIRVRLL